MTKIISISSEEKAKYVTFKLDKDFIKKFQKFLSEIEISRDKRKNLFKNYYIYTKGGRKSNGYKDTLQVVNNKEKTIKVEIFTGQSVIIVAIHHKKKDTKIGKALLKYFECEGKYKNYF